MTSTSILCNKRTGGSIIHTPCSTSTPQLVTTEPDTDTREESDEINKTDVTYSTHKSDHNVMKSDTPPEKHVRLSTKPVNIGQSSSVSLAQSSNDCVLQKQLKMNNWLSKQSIKSLQERANEESKETKQMYESLLAREESLFQEVSWYVNMKEVRQLRKKEVLHKKWTDRVHEPIRRRILKELVSDGFNEHTKKKRDLHVEYLEYVNKKGHAFLDTYPPDEYFPLGLISSKPCYARLRMKKIDDPLLSQQRARTAEDKTILRCQTGNIYSDKDIDEVRLPPLPLVPLGRHGTHCATWLAMPYQYIESPIRLASRAKMKSDMNAHHFDFHDWGKEVDQSIVDLEMQPERARSRGLQKREVSTIQVT